MRIKLCSITKSIVIQYKSLKLSFSVILLLIGFDSNCSFISDCLIFWEENSKGNGKIMEKFGREGSHNNYLGTITGGSFVTDVMIISSHRHKS